MKFLEIKDGLSINVKNIDAVERLEGIENQFKCKVHTVFGYYDVNFPYLTMLSILEAEHEEKEQEVLKEISQKVGNLPVFAG